jgi:DNA-directed RNA polymerase I subunit RPA1
MLEQAVIDCLGESGIEAHGSPLLKMSFETTQHFLTAALLRGEEDNGTSPSARIALGRTVDVGSGVFDLWSDMRPAA